MYNVSRRIFKTIPKRLLKVPAKFNRDIIDLDEDLGVAFARRGRRSEIGGRGRHRGRDGEEVGGQLTEMMSEVDQRSIVGDEEGSRIAEHRAEHTADFGA